MSKINFTHLRKNISIVFAAIYLALSCSTAQSASSSQHLDLKSTVAQTNCTAWKVGKFTAIQNNTDEPIHFNLGTVKKGSNLYLVGNVKYGNVFGIINPDKDNTFTGSEFSFIVNWNNGSAGRYHGSIDSDGYLTGETSDVANPDSQATWFVRETFKCIRR
jgi:hypothetical protein